MKRRKDKHPTRTTALWIVGATAAAAVGVYSYFYFFPLEGKPTEVSTTYATWFLAAFTVVLAVGIPITVWVAGEESKESTKRFLQQERDSFYAQLDRTYLEIQKLIIVHPYLGKPAELLKNPHVTAEQLARYDAFAFIVWNFIESIYDFTHNDGPETDKTAEQLASTWECIVNYEGARHFEWFMRDENLHKFKRGFREHIERAKWHTLSATLPIPGAAPTVSARGAAPA